MLDSKLIAAAIDSRAAWGRVAPHFKADEMSPSGGFWYKLVGEWYSRDASAQRIDKSLLVEQGEKRITNPKHRDSLIGFMNELSEPPSPDNVAQIALELKRYNVGMELSAAIGGHDSKKVAQLLPLFNELQAATALSDKRRTEWQDAVPIEQLFDRIGQENRIAIAPLKLNERCAGGALPGHHIVVFGRPEAGKSTFAINFAGSMVRQQLRVLYVGNEDQIDILKGRMLSRIVGQPLHVCEKDPQRAFRAFRDKGGEEFLLMSQLKHGGVDDIRRKLDSWDAQILVIDQIRNLSSEADGLTKSLEANAILTRALLLDYGLIGLSVTQARDGTERQGQEPPIWLGMGDVDSSRTGLPAQADLLVGIGVNTELASRNTRALSIPKNKLSSQDNAHEGFLVEIDKARSRIT